jgi:Protein of unknown function (DUF3570)
MKKICLTVVGLYLSLFAAFSRQTQADTSYKSRKLNFEEANIVSSYYRQDGNHSAVTGGIGTEKLTDIANVFDVKLSRWDKRNRKNEFEIELGIDHYTSASSDKVDPRTISSASHADTRIYPSITWNRVNDQKRTTLGAGLSFSNEFDYKSIGVNASFSQKTRNKNGEFTAKAQVYLDQVSLIYPVELRTDPRIRENGEGNDYPATPRNSYSGSLSYSQIINQRFQIMLLADLIYQKGYLGLPFHRVYFADNSVHVENLPDTRMKIPLGFRASYFMGDKFIIRTYYRYYHDDWELSAHTFDIEMPVKITPFFSISPFYRYYSQSAVKYFAPYQVHTAADQFYTSNYDLSKFNSNFYGTGFRIAPPKGIFGMQHLNMLELRYGHYTKTTRMNSDIISLNLKFK